MSSPSSRNTSASYHQFQQSLDQYVYFSPLTLGGASGRAVKIHKDLFLPFFCVVDPNAHDGQSIIRQIENLRTTCTIVRAETGSGYANNRPQSADHKVRLGKVNSAFHQVLIVKNLHVYYRVSQEAGDKAPSIYISKIKQVNEDAGGAPGLYAGQASVSGAIRPKKMEDHNADGKKIYINGAEPTAADAMAAARYATNDNSSLLFYCPTRATDELGMLRVPIKSRTTTDTVTELAKILKKNQKSSHGVSWYVQGEGANVLAEALKQISGELTSYEFRLINPIGNTARLVETLTVKKAKFEGEFFKYDQNRAALISLGKQKDQLMQAIGKLPAGKNYDKITRGYILKAINDLSSSGGKAVAQEAKINSSTKTFIQLLKSAGTFRK